MTAANGELYGVDIDLARDLGRQLGRPVEFVRTTWATLVPDAIAQRFDLAMSAINMTETRASSVDFSGPYADAPRVAIVRCTEQIDYASFADLDRPDVTIGVQASTSTAEYVHDRFANALIEEWDNLDRAFAHLARGSGDVIVAADFRLRGHPALCLALDGAAFHSTPLVVLFPRGSALIERTNAWIDERVADGSVARLLVHHAFE